MNEAGNWSDKPPAPESAAVSHLTGVNQTTELRIELGDIAQLNCQLRLADQVQPRIQKGIQNPNSYIKYSAQASFYALIRVITCPCHLRIDKKESRVANLRLRLKVWSTKLDQYRHDSVNRSFSLIISFCPMNKRIPFDWPSTMESRYKKYPIAF
jgi:hypothetical protein